MIETSVVKVKKGIDLANETAGALGEIVAEVEKASSIVGEISDQSNNQTRGLSEAKIGLDQINKVTQQTSSIAVQTAASSVEISEQAVELNSMIAQFKVGQGDKPYLTSDNDFDASNAQRFIEAN